MSEIPRTYPSWLKGEVKSAQKEYTEPTKLLADDGTLLSPGWARHMVFDYDRTKSTPTMRRKEWDFYQISDGRYMIQISFANISIGGYASAALVDLRNPKKNKKLAAGTLTAPTALFLGGIGTGIVVLDAVIVFAICALVTAVSISLVHAVTARLKIEQIFKYYWTVVSALALLSLALAWYGL